MCGKEGKISALLVSLVKIIHTFDLNKLYIRIVAMN